MQNSSPVDRHLLTEDTLHQPQPLLLLLLLLLG
jgi:hypothetical protein